MYYVTFLPSQIYVKHIKKNCQYSGTTWAIKLLQGRKSGVGGGGGESRFCFSVLHLKPCLRINTALCDNLSSLNSICFTSEQSLWDYVLIRKKAKISICFKIIISPHPVVQVVGRRAVMTEATVIILAPLSVLSNTGY